MALPAFPVEYAAWTESALFGFDNVLGQSQKLIFCESRFVQLADGQALACEKHPSVPTGCLSCSCTVDSF